MSFIGSKPFVQKMFALMSAEQLTTLNSLVNDLGDPIFVNFNEISEDNKGVSYVRLTFSELYLNSHFGFLIYIDDDNCGFFSFQDGFEEMKSIKIDPVNHKYWNLQQHLTAEEFRRALDDAIEEVIPDIDSDVNIITYDVTLSSDTATITPTEDEYELMQDVSKECIVVINYNSGSHSTLSRVTVSSGRVIFSAQRPYSDGLEDVTAEFDRIGTESPYTYTGTLTISEISSGGGLDPATAADKVLVSNDSLEWEESDSVPLAENLTSVAVNNDALYSKGPTGGLADISTGEEAYLSEVKGYSIVWNQLLDSSHTSVTLNNSHIYIGASFTNASSTPTNAVFTLYQNSTSTISYSSAVNTKLFDLTLMFGSNDRIPFSLSTETEYVANGSLPAQTVTAVQRFQRLFANVDLYNAPYDGGSLKDVSVTSLVETGQNLWNENDSSMVSNGLQLLAGYRYEIYLDSSTTISQIYCSFDNGSTWTNAYMSSAKRGDGYWIWYHYPNVNMLIKSYTSAIKFVGFVHSGNYCLTTGSTRTQSYPTTTVDIPEYISYTYNVGVADLMGLTNVYDTKDYTRVGQVDLSTLSWTDNGDSTYTAVAPSDMDTDITNVDLLSDTYIQSEMSISGGSITIASSSSPTGVLYYQLENQIATGEDAFEPISIEVNDMGMEYFTGTNYAPVNQLSVYYQNLKDKLVNLEEIEVSAVNYNSSNTPLSGLKIGNNYYSLAPYTVYNTNYNNSSLSIGSDARAYNYSVAYGPSAWATSNSGYVVAIGYNCSSNNTGSIVIGSQARSYGNYAISIGANTYNNRAAYSIAIGCSSMNYITDSISFDGDSASSSGAYNGGQRTLQMYSPEKIFFRNEVVSNTKTTFASYTSGHYLSEYIQNNSLTLTEASGVYTSSETFSGSEINGVHITVKLSTNVVVGLDLLPYDSDNSQAFTAYGLESNTPTFISAYIDSTGAIVITPASATITETSYYLR